MSPAAVPPAPPGPGGGPGAGPVPEVRRRLALALDVPDLAAAGRLAAGVGPWFGVAKVGLELFSAAGPAAVEHLGGMGFAVFADLKLHDIPTTVGRAARVLGRLGAAYVNFHASGGVDMLRAGVEGLAEGARDAGHAPPVALAVTVLTSDADASAFDTRLRAAIDAGCGGVVCSVQEVAAVKRARADLVAVVPGVRLAGGDAHDQRRVGTPEQVARAGADLLVIGRAVTAAAEPAAAARAVHEAVARALAP
ncbi:MAG: orotidine 5'-phosphate decarboxylase [Acidimicrobiia bacterium]|nr:MAG: orotidine 5'-phosphate decarboxylase [Acidimicrobiia bacterium]